MSKYPALYFSELNKTVPLDRFHSQRCVVGRDESASIPIPDMTCSRQQFAVAFDQGRYFVESISQTVPTFRNGNPLQSREELQHEDELTCGGTSIRFLRHGPAESNGSPLPGRPHVPIESLPPFGPAATVVANFREQMEAVVQQPEIPLDRNAVIGRAPDTGGIVLDHPRVSRRHAEVRIREGGKTFLRDLGSSNGTFINGERISGYRELRKSDRIDIGPFTFRFTGRALVQSTREGNLRVIARGLNRVVRSHTTGQSVRILDDITLNINPGEFVCILGSSGSGKSTLMQALSARKPADAGQVFLNDLSLYENFAALKQSIALVPQKDVLHEDLTLEECIRYTARLRLPPDTSGRDLERAVQAAIARVDLSHRKSTLIRNLSGGQKKRAALANETVSRPELLFLDEVTSGLDEGTDWEMMRLFRRMADAGMTVICVTHTVANVEDFCHKLVIMAPPGVLAYYGPPAAAKKYFTVDKLGDLYRKLAEAHGEEWRDRFRRSDEYRQFIREPLALAQSEVSPRSHNSEKSDGTPYSLGEIQRQFSILASRFSRLLVADKRTLGIAFAQSALIGTFLVMVFGKVPHPDPKEYSLLFFLGISCFWCGCNNASKEIVKERLLYGMERDVNLSLPSYLLSKAVLLGAFGIAQVALLFGLVHSAGTIPGDPAKQFLAMVFSVLAGTATGLFLSALAKTEDQASTLVPIALIPQILLSGVIVSDLPKIPDTIAHIGISGFWVYRSMASILANDRYQMQHALSILAAHTTLFILSAGLLMGMADPRGQKIYGRAVNQKLKTAI